MQRSDNGILIAMEGIDGAGKTTQVALLEQFFLSAGERVKRSKEPTDGPWGQKIRQSAANGRMTWTEELHALIQDRTEHIQNVIQPALNDGQIVILDRYFYSTIAYQGTTGGDVDALAAQMFDISLEPDVVVLIDVPHEIGLARIEHARGDKPKPFENLENLERVRAVFQHLATTHRNVVLVDGTPPIEEVRKTILAKLLESALVPRLSMTSGPSIDSLRSSNAPGTASRLAKLRRAAGLLTKPQK